MTVPGAPADFTRRAVDLPEFMDDPACDLATLRRTYRQFGRLNALIAGWRRVYVRDLRPRLLQAPLTLLDIGCGGGDVPRQLARWARRDGLDLTVTAIDADPRAIAFASAQPGPPNVTYRQALSSDLVREGHTFGAVTSNHLLHHLTAAELSGLLRDCEHLGRVVVHSDLVRSAAAYRLFSLAAHAFPGTFIRADGLRSIRRSFTPAELQAAAPPGWTVRPLFPFRQLLTWEAGRA
ncbi:class I SAM-dependent methyltransferase [Deinococcus sedimenti]|uniref:Methyltransferase domain-containing protein n=1 Tax=Deinococcus sedimenti TaxID=1867090 RepID=A0ABQ2S366_9DEIO|nr:class I SAM-dependent methyltransferase [Deinococcus sedimenti]GGR93449.1 hypothetical protein GCM10008960_20540 [Deinococcus sedimenti]